MPIAKASCPQGEQTRAAAVVGRFFFEQLARDRLADRGQGLPAEAPGELVSHAIQVGLIEGVLNLEDTVVHDPRAIDQDRDDAVAVETHELEVLDHDAAHVRDEHDADVLRHPRQLARRFSQKLRNLPPPLS